MGGWSPRPARACWRPWSRWPAPTAPAMRVGGQRRADALAELARRVLEGGRRPQLSVLVDLDGLQAAPGWVATPSWAAGPRGVSAAGLRRGGDPGPGHPPARRPRCRPRRPPWRPR